LLKLIKIMKKRKRGREGEGEGGTARKITPSLALTLVSVEPLFPH